MPKRLAILSSLVIALALAGGGSVYAYDHARRDRIAEGVTINGVAVGGMTAQAARDKVRAQLLDPLNRPVVVRHKARRFTLRAQRARVGLDVAGSVERALAVSRDGGVLVRTWRDVRGERLDRDVRAEVTWSRAAVRRLIARVRRAVDRPARDAKVDLTTGRVDPRPSRNGVAVRGGWLSGAVRRTLLSTGERRPLRVRTRVVRPEVTTRELQKRYPAVLIIDRAAFRLTLYKHLKPAKSYGIAVGQVGLETPAGLYRIQNKAVNPAWHVPQSDWAGDLAGKIIPGDDPSNPIKARWMGIYDGAGIHGTADDASIGSAASHGCIRMHIPDVVELYDQVPVGAPVFIS